MRAIIASSCGQSASKNGSYFETSLSNVAISLAREGTGKPGKTCVHTYTYTCIHTNVRTPTPMYTFVNKHMVSTL